jgi:hypothetical protein
MEIQPIRNYNLLRLQQYLDYELSGTALLFFSWFWGILLFLAGIAALVFIPFMLKVLYEERKYGWIVYFFVIVILPAAVIYMSDVGFTAKILLGYLPLALFFFYCFTLKLAVRGWVTEYKFQRNILQGEDSFNNYKF